MRISQERLAQIGRLTQERDGLSTFLAQRQAEIKLLEQHNNELEYCQRLWDEEMIKAEAQIGLIKDILIRDKAF